MQSIGNYQAPIFSKYDQMTEDEINEEFEKSLLVSCLIFLNNGESNIYKNFIKTKLVEFKS